VGKSKRTENESETKGLSLYSELHYVKVPTVRKQKRKDMKRTEEPDNRQSTLYHLSIVEENCQEGLVKVRYVGYGEEYDE